ncbi:MAG: hypothetical protein A2756_00285 [Candidatus Ryanbacteria bacterium RIFCSPHIGHO2_01_FULL_48_27]|uniref:UDP-glucose/GDP-mannose dehydrogenase dimerisation domain-containing protein n=1 Tax=Candidatus Ryanbacteria bacterium RIFCSPHIGHO2_01_FULL_48_27 TaxID=1802115 RepID=A0A1G2G5U1_9BACT|nr:MAG: hypothetical protein A2756_00285 [Candidatus Ryanbacteria bacterium RIFCSPHIGHO2_01_FULL_48_27]
MQLKDTGTRRISAKIPIGIIGVGMVGGNLKRYFEEVRGYVRGKNLFVYDANSDKHFTDDVNQAAIVFVAVPTPRARSGACDTSALDAAVGMLRGEKIVVFKSTIPPGTTERYQHRYPQHYFLFNPEFLTESRSWEDMLRPDRQIVAHTVSRPGHASAVLGVLPEAFFSSPGTLGTYTFIRVNATEAELGKYAGNVFGALKVAYANILFDIATALEGNLRRSGIDTPVLYDHVRQILAHDRRIGDSWLDVDHGSYRGFGGYCFPKDTSALIATARSLFSKMPRDATERVVFAKAIQFLESLWEYNEVLLESQGLTIDAVSKHDADLVRRRGTSHTQKNIRISKKRL